MYPSIRHLKGFLMPLCDSFLCPLPLISSLSTCLYTLIMPVALPLPSLCLTNRSASAQSLSRVRLFVTPWTAACPASLSITSSWSLLKLCSMYITSMMPANHLILCHPLLLLPSIFPSIRVFSNESVLRIRWPKYWSFSFSISTSNEYLGLIAFRM